MASEKITLTETVYWTKRLGLFLGIGIVALLVIKIIISLLSGVQGSNAKYITPDNKCGNKIPVLKLSSLPLAKDIEPEVTLETPDGRLPDLPSVVNVYKYDHPGQGLNALEEATKLAEELGFPGTKRRKITDTDYRWSDQLDLRQLDLNLENLNFYISTDYSKTIPPPEEALPSEEDAKKITYRWLQSLGLVTEDISEEKSTVYFLKIVDGKIRYTSSRQDADFVRTDFFQEKDLIYIDTDLAEADNLGKAISDHLIEDRSSDSEGNPITVLRFPTDIVTNTLDKGNISVTTNGSTLIQNDGSTNLLAMEYFNWKLPDKACGTYEIISPSEAFDEVKAGNGYLIKLLKKFGGDPFEEYKPQTVKKITILEVDLVYLDTRAKQEYLQPVYMLTGEAVLGDNTKAEIVFYVPALDNNSY